MAVSDNLQGNTQCCFCSRKQLCSLWVLTPSLIGKDGRTIFRKRSVILSTQEHKHSLQHRRKHPATVEWTIQVQEDRNTIQSYKNICHPNASNNNDSINTNNNNGLSPEWSGPAWGTAFPIRKNENVNGISESLCTRKLSLPSPKYETFSFAIDWWTRPQPR